MRCVFNNMNQTSRTETDACMTMNVHKVTFQLKKQLCDVPVGLHLNMPTNTVGRIYSMINCCTMYIVDALRPFSEDHWTKTFPYPAEISHTPNRPCSEDSRVFTRTPGEKTNWSLHHRMVLIHPQHEQL